MADDNDSGQPSTNSGIISRFLFRATSLPAGADAPCDLDGVRDEGSLSDVPEVPYSDAIGPSTDNTHEHDVSASSSADNTTSGATVVTRRRTLSALLLGPRAEMIYNQRESGPSNASTTPQDSDDEDLDQSVNLENLSDDCIVEGEPQSQERLFDALLKKINNAAEGFIKPINVPTSSSAEHSGETANFEMVYSDDLLMDRICRRLEGKKD